MLSPSNIDPNLKSKWVDALRSGDFVQGVANFEKDGKFCCLGVLCVAAGIPTSGPYGLGNWREANKLISGSLDDYRVSKRLADMNDEGVSFSIIADRIEREM